MKRPLLEFTSKGIYCSKGNFYIDPWSPVSKAIITHAHADHAYQGHGSYLAHVSTVPILNYRLKARAQRLFSIQYGEPLLINGVEVSFYPAGHIIGSSQIRVEYKGEVWVASGDYKLENDGLSVPFEPVKCHVFITESTFALPCFQWEPQQTIFDEINQWRRQNRSQGLSSILIGYSLGKAQRLLKGLDPSLGPIYAHGAVWNITDIIRQQCPSLPPLIKASADIQKKDLIGSTILAPPSVFQSPWLNRFYPYRIGYASGWMSIRGLRRRKGADAGFVLSDHADWQALEEAIRATGAERIIATHGFASSFARWLNEQGYEAQEAQTFYEEDKEDEEEI